MSILNLFEEQKSAPDWQIVEIGIPPVFSTKSGYLYEHDSLEIMKMIPEESIDMIFADPPYNIKKS